MLITKNDEVAVALAGRSYIYQLLKYIFADEPTAQLLDLITEDFTYEVLSLFVSEDEMTLFAHLVTRIKERRVEDELHLLDDLKGEYTALFIGPNKLVAPPWESVYVNKARVILQESTLKVREFYRRHQLLPANYPRVADDHLAIELDFMAKLSKRVEESEDVSLLKEQLEFLDSHLLRWVPQFATDIQSSKTHRMYPFMAKITETALLTDRMLLEELIASV